MRLRSCPGVGGAAPPNNREFARSFIFQPAESDPNGSRASRDRTTADHYPEDDLRSKPSRESAQHGPPGDLQHNRLVTHIHSTRWNQRLLWLRLTSRQAAGMQRSCSLIKTVRRGGYHACTGQALRAPTVHPVPWRDASPSTAPSINARCQASPSTALGAQPRPLCKHR